jgi:hypothetical protein
MPLVLVHNDVVANPAHRWNDLEGVQYHYPSKYRNLIKAGEPFVYYRGVHRTGGKRGQAEYVGTGRIGDIWPDPEPAQHRRQAWYCGIEDYNRFPKPVPAKINNTNLEDIRPNLWRDSVRSMAADVYRRILELASQRASEPKAIIGTDGIKIMPADTLIVPPVASRPRKGEATPVTYRMSKQARDVGDWAERVVLRFIQEQMLGCSNCVHRAAINEKPGWDIDYLDSSGLVQRVEVKGSVGAAFDGVEMTANEIAAARIHGDRYWLYLVAGCLTNAPQVQTIQNPAAKLAADEWSAAPTLFSIRFRATS